MSNVIELDKARQQKESEPAVDPRISRTADAMYEADKLISSLEKSFSEHFPDGPEAA